MFKTLEVGSGAFPKGDVNIDLYVTQDERRKQKFNLIDIEIPEFFIKADAHHLPFRNAIFEKAICVHTLEHLKNPYVALCEIYRTLQLNGIFYIAVPNAKLVTREHSSHLYSWSSDSLQNLLRYVGFKIEKVTDNIKGINMEMFCRK